jgi:hypothetical protein
MSAPAFFPTEVFAPVNAALSGLAESNGAPPPGPLSPTQLPDASSTAAAAVAARLAAVIAGHAAAAARRPRLCEDRARGERYGDDGAALQRELALLHAYGAWMEHALAPGVRLRIARPLVREIGEAVYRFAVAHHVGDGGADGGGWGRFESQVSTFIGAGAVAVNWSASRGGSDDEPRGSCARVWPTRADARRYALHCALAARYGSAEAAPTAAAIAGAPLVLYVCERLADGARVEVEGGHARVRGRAADGAVWEWRRLVSGACVFEVLRVGDVSGLRVIVAGALKEAVKSRGLSPTLVILEADADATLCSGAEVLQAVCASYGALLHIEGPALAVLGIRPEVVSRLEFNLSACVSCSSLLLDVGSIFEVDDMCSVVCFSKYTTDGLLRDVGGNGAVEALEGDQVVDDEAAALDLGRALSLWWLIQRRCLHRAQRTISAAANENVALLDRLAVLSSNVRAVSCGAAASVLLAYSSSSMDAGTCDSLTNAIFDKLASDSLRARAVGMRMASFQCRKWILLSPVWTATVWADWSPTAPGKDAENLSGADLALGIVSAAGMGEIAQAGASSFVSTAKQCSDIEVVLDSRFNTALYFGAVRVVPFSLAAGNGRWQRDADLSEKVEKLTCALAAALDTATDIDFKGFLIEDLRNEGGVPILCIGPLHKTGAKSILSETRSDLPLSSETLTEPLDFQDAARRQAQFAAEYVGEAAGLVIKALSNAALTVKSSDDATDGVLPGTFSDVEVQSAEDSIRETRPLTVDDDKFPKEPPSLVMDDAYTDSDMEHGGKMALDEMDLLSTAASDAADKHQPMAAAADANANGVGTGSIWERLFGIDDDDGSDDDAPSSPLPGDYFRP